MKKTLIILAILGCLGILGVAFAQERAPECCRLRNNFTDIDQACTQGAWVGPANCNPQGDPCYCPQNVTAQTDAWGACCLFNTIYNAATWAMRILLAIAVIVGIIGAFQIITSGGDPGKVDKGRNQILYAIVGVVVAILARALPALVRLMFR